MTDFNTMANSPVTVDIGGKKFLIKRLSLDEIFGLFEPIVISKSIEQAQQIAGSLTGQDKVQFMKSVWKDLPAGEHLSALVQEEMGSIQGIKHLLLKAIQKATPETPDDVLAGQVSLGEMEQFAPLVEYICGVSDNPLGESKKAEKKVKPKV